MKLIFKFRGAALLATSLIVLLFSQCNERAADKSPEAAVVKSNDSAVVKNDDESMRRRGCDGYIGKLTDSLAEKLVKTCHFIPVEQIAEWTARYQKNKKRDAQGKLPDLGTLLGDSVSFNSCIIRKIITNEKCIGLRVVYGMSEDYKVHVIFVGIKPDYSTLYIKEDGTCCDGDAKKQLAAPPPPSTGKLGGAEYGQIP